MAVLQYDHRDDWKVSWRAHRRPEGDYTVVQIEAKGEEEVDSMRAEIVEAVQMVNDVASRDPLSLMVRADEGLVEVLVD